MTNLQPLYDLIIKGESLGAVTKQNVDSPYNVVWGGIAPRHRPQHMRGKRLTQMTVMEVLNWQDSIDRLYNSEAAGAFQIMEDTLRPMVKRGDISAQVRFDANTQKACANILLEEKDLSGFLGGFLTVQQFGNRLARVWASLPVLIGPNRGLSYYHQPGFNEAHIKPEEVEMVLGDLLTKPVATEPPAEPSETEERLSYLENELADIKSDLRIIASAWKNTDT